MKTKKADLPSAWIVTIILLIVGFGIILFFLLRFTWQETVNREVCHESVVLKATMPAAAENYIPLKCKTEKYCITAGSGKCNEKGQEFYNEEGISKVKVKNELEISRFLAREIVECWSMMGEGKINLFSQYWAGTFGVGERVYPSCVICSRVAFDKKSLDEAKIDLAKVNVLDYMMNYKAPNKDVSYYEFITKTSPAKMSFKDKINFYDILEKDGKLETGKEVVFDDLEEASKKSQNKEAYEKETAVLFMQISAPDHWESGKNVLKAALGATVGSFVLAPAITAKFIKTAAASWKITLPLAAIFGVYQIGSVAYNRAVTAGYCGDVSLGGEARGGCSVARIVNYDAEDISKYCQVVESIA